MYDISGAGMTQWNEYPSLVDVVEKGRENRVSTKNIADSILRRIESRLYKEKKNYNSRWTRPSEEYSLRAKEYLLADKSYDYVVRLRDAIH